LNELNPKQITIILAHAFVGWILCAATMGIGMAFTSLKNALVVHAIAAPVFFAIVASVYFKKFNYTTPIVTALIFVGFVAIVDFFVVALLINKSLEMFYSFLGTWIPFALIFLSTYFTGLIFVEKKKV
jgi:hypothetical protein